MRDYTFYKDGLEVHTDNLTRFCQLYKLQRRHMVDVVNGSRQSHRGWSLPPDMRKTRPTPINVGDENDPNGPGSMTVEQVLDLAEIAAEAQNDPEYEALVKSRTEKIRRGEQIEVRILDQ